MNTAVFVDRDGTLNEMVFDPEHGVLDSPFRPGQVVLKPGATRFVGALSRAGFKVIVVTNQPGLAKGTLTDARLRSIHRRLTDLLAEGGARVDAIYCCPHHPVGGRRGDPRYVTACECRKPKPGLLLRAAAEHAVELGCSYMVGDGTVDVEAGRGAGVRTILTAAKKIEVAALLGERRSHPDAWVESLDDALDVILSARLSRATDRAP